MTVTALDVLKVVFQVDMPDAVIGANVYWLRLQDPAPVLPTDAQVVTAVDTYLNNCYTTLTAIVSNAYSGGDFTVERMQWDGLKWETAENIGSGDVAWNPTNAQTGVPHGAAGVITGRTSRPQTRGRKFLPGLPEALITDSTLQASILTALTNFAIQYLLDTVVLTSSFLEPVVVGQSGPSSGLVYPLVSAVIPDIIGYQRRRKPGVGQ